jgi:tetratricopeptide (TPR) repeat protein
MTLSMLSWCCVLIASLLLYPTSVHSAGTPGATSAESQALTGDEAAAAAARHYREAMALKAEAWHQQAEAANSSEAAARNAALASERSAYQAMIDQLQLALKNSPRYVEAATELGYALREHFAAVEYRGQAYLAINNIDKAKQDYLTLFRYAPELADKLMSAMDHWLASQPADSTGAFSQWLRERKALAGPSANRSGRW